MNILLVITWSSVAITVSALIALGILLFIASYGISELQRKKFIVEYEDLKNFINNPETEITKKNYDAIYHLFNETYCYSDGDIVLIKHLWTNFRVKFRDIVPVEDKDFFPDIK